MKPELLGMTASAYACFATAVLNLVVRIDRIPLQLAGGGVAVAAATYFYIRMARTEFRSGEEVDVADRAARINLIVAAALFLILVVLSAVRILELPRESFLFALLGTIIVFATWRVIDRLTLQFLGKALDALEADSDEDP